MTQDIGSDRHRRPSSPEIDIVRLKERHSALSSDFSDYKEMWRENTKMQTTQNDIIIDKLSKIERELALGTQRFEKIERDQNKNMADTTESIKAITGRVEAVEADKRGPVAIVLATVTAIGSGVVAYFK